MMTLNNSLRDIRHWGPKDGPHETQHILRPGVVLVKSCVVRAEPVKDLV